MMFLRRFCMEKNRKNRKYDEKKVIDMQK